MVEPAEPKSIGELQEILRESYAVQVWARKIDASVENVRPVVLRAFAGNVDFFPEDQVATFKASTPLVEMQQELAGFKLCVPCRPRTGTLAGSYMTAGDGWRDWVIGGTYMLPDGTVCKSGSHAVKNVAGYDVHRFLAGTRGSLAICLDLTLRLYPLVSDDQGPEISHENSPVSDPTQIRFMQRAKEVFDPSRKLNPGVWGFM